MSFTKVSIRCFLIVWFFFEIQQSFSSLKRWKSMKFFCHSLKKPFVFLWTALLTELCLVKKKHLKSIKCNLCFCLCFRSCSQTAWVICLKLKLKNSVKLLLSRQSLRLLLNTRWVIYILGTLDALVQVKTWPVSLYWFGSCNISTGLKLGLLTPLLV